MPTAIQTALTLLGALSLLSLAACQGDDGDDGSSTTASTTADATTTSTTTTTTTTGEGTSTGEGTTTGETTTTTTTGSGAVSFAGDVFPIITVACTCHVDALPGGLAMPDASTAYANLVGVPASGLPTMDRVAAGDLDNSYLIRKLLGTQAEVGGIGSKMPLGDTLTPEEQMTFEAWVEGGGAP